MSDIIMDFPRLERCGIEEAVFCQGKSSGIALEAIISSTPISLLVKNRNSERSMLTAQIATSISLSPRLRKSILFDRNFLSGAVSSTAEYPLREINCQIFLHNEKANTLSRAMFSQKVCNLRASNPDAMAQALMAPTEVPLIRSGFQFISER